jgi:hypothetical protein
MPSLTFNHSARLMYFSQYYLKNPITLFVEFSIPDFERMNLYETFFPQNNYTVVLKQ